MIRLLRASDLEAVARMESELFSSASWSLSMLEQEVNAPARTYFVWEGEPPHLPQNVTTCSTEILGYGGIWYDGADAEIMTIGVAKKAQRAGIGRALLTALIDAAVQQGARRMLLEVRVDNEPAKQMYQRFGFKPMGLRRHYYQPEDVDALTMSLDLEEDRHE